MIVERDYLENRIIRLEDKFSALESCINCIVDRDFEHQLPLPIKGRLQELLTELYDIDDDEGVW